MSFLDPFAPKNNLIVVKVFKLYYYICLNIVTHHLYKFPSPPRVTIEYSIKQSVKLFNY